MNDYGGLDVAVDRDRRKETIAEPLTHRRNACRDYS
jgi:hypothetical protein